MVGERRRGARQPAAGSEQRHGACGHAGSCSAASWSRPARGQGRPPAGGRSRGRWWRRSRPPVEEVAAAGGASRVRAVSEAPGDREEKPPVEEVASAPVLGEARRPDLWRRARRQDLWRRGQRPDLWRRDVCPRSQDSWRRPPGSINQFKFPRVKCIILSKKG